MINYLYNTKTKTLKKLRAYRTKEIQVWKSLNKLIWILADNKVYSLGQIAKLYYGRAKNKDQVKINLERLSKMLKIEQVIRCKYKKELEYGYKLVDRVWITNE